MNFIWVRDRSCPAKDDQSIEKKELETLTLKENGPLICRKLFISEEIEKEVQYVPYLSAKKTKDEKQIESQKRNLDATDFIAFLSDFRIHLMAGKASMSYFHREHDGKLSPTVVKDAIRMMYMSI